MSNSSKDAGDYAAITFCCALVLSCFAIVVYPIFRSILADGRIEYCYVENERHQVPNQPDVVLYRLHGFRPWRSDRTVAVNLKSLEEVKTEADRLGCPLK